MTAAVAVMSTSTTPMVPKRHCFSIESLIGTPETSPISSTTVSPPKPLPIRPLLNREHNKEDRHREREKEREREREREAQKEREICDMRERQCRGIEREAELLRERELVMESMREREREFREMRDRELAREREIREIRDNRDGRGSNPHFQRLSPGSSSPPSPQTEKSLTPQSENRLSIWPGDEFKHLLGNLHSGHVDSSGLYQPLRVCNRALASMVGMPGVGAPPSTLGVGMPSHFSHLPINPLLYNLPRELTHQSHHLLAARYPGFMHPRYQMGPPPGLLFHPYRKPKRNRTAFSPSQLLQLEQAFERNHYVVGQERKTLASKLQLTETQVKVWFQNRRTKHKRMKAEEDGGSSGSHVEGHDGDHGKGVDGNDFSGYVDHDDDDDDEACSDDDEEELSVTEDC